MRQLKITKQVTNRETASLDKYLQEIGKVDLITAEEEVELAQRVKQGDQLALEKLTKANLRFVVSVAKQYQNQGLTLPDLINEGNLGLIKAAQRFEALNMDLKCGWFQFPPYVLYKAKVCLPLTPIPSSGLKFCTILESMFPASLPNVISNFDLIFVLTFDSGIDENSDSAIE